MRFGSQRPSLLRAAALLAVVPTVLCADILQTNGFSTCGGGSDITVQRLNIAYDRTTNKVNFDVAGTSEKEQKVMATLIVTAYGKEVYRNSFNPCDENIEQLCPVPSGDFAAKGSQSIPQSYVDNIPSIAFSIPDLDGMAKLELTSIDTNETVACIESTVSNGKTFSVPSVSYVAAGIAGAALLLTGLSALGAAGQPGVATPSPTFGEVIGWFQGIAMNGMISVKYPAVYQSFTRNFGFSTLLINWTQMQESIDSFRGKTGGNLTSDSVATLKNTTLVFSTSNGNNTKRSLEDFMVFARQLETSINGTQEGAAPENENKINKAVQGIQAYVEEYSIPQTNTFMTVLLFFACLVAGIIVGILLFKVILESWALFGSFPKRLTGFRKRYWLTISNTIVNLVLLLYGIWVLYCVYQFKLADAWGPKVLAGVTLSVFTGILAFFTWKIWSRARQYKKAGGDVNPLYDDKDTWRKYGLFYENYKKGYWWLFMPLIVYMFAKGCVIAAGSGQGLVQAGGQLIIESLLLILLLWVRPYSLKSGNWINIVIQIVRVLSIVCILVFVEELGVAQTTKTITGVVLIVVQSVLTGVLAILILVNSIIMCCRENPHRRKRKEAEKLRALDDLTPLDARESMMMVPPQNSHRRFSQFGHSGPTYDPVPHVDTAYHGHNNGSADLGVQHSLLNNAAALGGQGHSASRSITPPGQGRQPKLPSLDLGSDVNRNQNNGWNRY